MSTSSSPNRLSVVHVGVGPEPNPDALNEYRLTGQPRLFDLHSEPSETTDVAADQPQLVKDLTTRLEAHLTSPPPSPAVPQQYPG